MAKNKVKYIIAKEVHFDNTSKKSNPTKVTEKKVNIPLKTPKKSSK
jgi:hypothetical protein